MSAMKKSEKNCLSMKPLLSRSLFFVLLIAACSPTVPDAKSATITNFIKNTAYSNASLTITAGDTVVWINKDGSQHSVTGNANNSPPEAFCGTPTFGLNGSCMSTFTNTGTFHYFCRVHASMLGTLVVNPKPNAPPAVTITNPPNNAVFIAPATVSMGATAADGDGSVIQVEFFVNGNSAGIATSPPYGATTNNLAAGSYTLSAVATDNQNAKSTNSISFRVDAAPPIQPLLVSPTRGPAGKFRFDVVGQAGQTYLIEGAIVLGQWSLLATINTNIDTFRFIDAVSTLDNRFYRVRTP